jgi:hypothetical protein
MMMTTSHADRRNAGQKERVYTLDGAELVVTEDDSVKRRLPLADIVQVRLAIEMAGADSQIVCRISDREDTEIVIGSRSWAGVGVYEQRADTFSAFLTALHKALEPRWGEIRFLEGQSMAFMATMFILGLVLAALGGGFFVLLTLVQGKVLGWGALPFFGIGFWLAAMFRPRGPKTYDPAIYTQPSKREQAAEAAQ